MSKRVRPGYYRQEVNKTSWEVPDRYRDLKQVGTGAYGTVWRGAAAQTKGTKSVSAATLPCMMETLHVLAATVLIDTSARHLSDDLIMRGGPAKVDVEKKTQLSMNVTMSLSQTTARGKLKSSHNSAINRDLKPGNLAINQDCELKILDFGLARQTDSEMTGYVVTRWYRAPEVILSWMHYTQTVDIWSVGCIMAEMLQGKPLFKGSDHLDQLTEIMKITGKPTPEFTSKLISEDAKSYIKSLPKLEKKDLHTVFSTTNPQAVSVLERMFLLDPESRATAAEALALPYFTEFREPEEETEAQPYDHSLDHTEQSLNQWKRHTFTEILSFKPVVPESKETSL
ncbi:Mitogen-activated protein kinase [Scophthalmus maximus]|uniref:mitogen-activated protein kinase n=1 Tax=Scophthalmus maximus TaxID=52904 RepID=A0A2U9BWV6_SCOMX|nr:Mitogen-activated protein kinase [Scophthalmus maximus]